MARRTPCRELDIRDVVEGDSLCRVLCYPSGDSICCYNRLEELSRLGITGVYSFGDVQIEKGVWVVGKGHAAIVALAQHMLYGLVALKIRRVDSKRDSLEEEGMLLETVSRLGYAPKPISYSKNFIAREYVDGSTLERILKEGDGGKIKKAIVSLVKAAFAIDSIGVDVEEIVNPTKQIIYLCNDLEKPMFIDLESARLRPHSSNVTKIISFIIRMISKDRVGSSDMSSKRIVLLELAKKYKVTMDVRQREDIVGELLMYIQELFAG
ncbi:MAG: hypothetical protein QW632_04110 [Ignisphaera sp.]